MSLKHAEFDTAVGLSYTLLTTSFQTLTTLSNDVDQLFLLNSTDSLVIVQAPLIINNVKGYRDLFRLPAGIYIAYDGRANKKTVCQGDIKVKYSGTAPTQGEFSVTGIR